MEKLISTRFWRASRNRSPAKGAFAEFGGLKMVLKSSPGRLGRPLGVHLGDLGSLLESSWGALGRSSELLGRFRDTHGAILERSCALLRTSVRFWTVTGSILDAPAGDFEHPYLDFGLSEKQFWVSARCAFDDASDVEFRMICFRFSLEFRM